MQYTKCNIQNAIYKIMIERLYNKSLFNTNKNEMMEVFRMKILVCKKCGNIIEVIKDKCPAITCCGEDMKELVPGTSDGAHEKHLPVIEQDGNKVTVSVGSVEHPMQEAHYIEWIAIETENGVQRIDLKPEQAPKAVFTVNDDDKLVSAYAYCNLHSLWKTEV